MPADDTSTEPSRSLRGSDVLSDPLVAELLDARLVAVLTTLEPDGAVQAERAHARGGAQWPAGFSQPSSTGAV